MNFLNNFHLKNTLLKNYLENQLKGPFRVSLGPFQPLCIHKWCPIFLGLFWPLLPPNVRFLTSNVRFFGVILVPPLPPQKPDIIKRILIKIVIHFWKKKEVFVVKKLKKNRFRDFRSQKIRIFYQSRLSFWKTCQDSQKMTLVPSSWDVHG